MQVSKLKEIVGRELFRPFSIRLSNGAQYAFNEPRELGATQDFVMLFYFSPGGGAVRIDTENIVEVFKRPSANGA